MSDSSALWLSEQIRQSIHANVLWVCDENYLNLLPLTSASSNQLTLLSNRYDIAKEATSKGFDCTFNDMDLNALNQNSFDAIFYRISKEKAVCHHVINQAFDKLSVGGTLYLCGQKNEGIKTYLEKAAQLFGCEKSIQKDGSNYFSALRKNTAETEYKLDDQDYTAFKPLTLPSGLTIHTKPGQFGWNKCDEGSQLLVDYLKEAITPDRPFEHLIDLGCGYGFLSLETRWINAAKRTLTDNNAAALATATANTDLLAPSSCAVVAGDAGDSIEAKADLILCNPPFHQGFDVSGDLTDKFLTRAAQLLTPKGSAYFVVNQFIPVPQKAERLFKTCERVVTNKRFSVYRLAHSKFC